MTSIRFHEVMKGRIAPQYTSPSDGYEYNGALAASLAARIDIKDLQLFVDPTVSHVGVLSVELSIPVLSNRAFVGEGGTFELFRPSELDAGGDGYLMVYDATVTDGDRVYEMKSHKNLRPRRLRGVWRLWPETTTLSVSLRDVTPPRHGDSHDDEVELPALDPMPDWLAVVRAGRLDESEADRDFHHPRNAAGILHLSLWAFARQILGMRGFGSPWYGRWFAVARFMAFFAGSLVEIYVLGKREAPR